MQGAGTRQGLVGHDDQGVTGQQGQRLAVQLVHGGQAAPGVGVVKAGHVVMHQRSAVQQLDADGRCVAEFGGVFATGPGHGQAQLRANAGATGEHRVPHGGHQPGGRSGALRQHEGLLQRLLDACHHGHTAPPGWGGCLQNVTTTCVNLA